MLDIALPTTADRTISFAGLPGLPNPPGWDDIPGAHGSTPQTEGFRDLIAASTGGITYLKRLTLGLKDGRIERVYYPIEFPQAHAREVCAWLGMVHRTL
jgi:hypothetical protein